MFISVERVEGNYVKAVLFFFVYFLFLVIFVYFGIYYLLNNYPKMDFIFENTVFYAVIIGTPVAILAGLTAYFSKGDIYRLIFGLSRVGLTILYVFMIYKSLNIGWQEEDIFLQITIPTIIILLIIGFSLKGIYYFLEYKIYSKKYERHNDKIDENEFEKSSYY
ncbi:MAG: hypothetical protein ACOC85_03435 [Thermoplasmatota archaeon]